MDTAIKARSTLYEHIENVIFNGPF